MANRQDFFKRKFSLIHANGLNFSVGGLQKRASKKWDTGLKVKQWLAADAACIERPQKPRKMRFFLRSFFKCETDHLFAQRNGEEKEKRRGSFFLKYFLFQFFSFFFLPLSLSFCVYHFIPDIKICDNGNEKVVSLLANKLKLHSQRYIELILRINYAFVILLWAEVIESAEEKGKYEIINTRKFFFSFLLPLPTKESSQSNKEYAWVKLYLKHTQETMDMLP